MLKKKKSVHQSGKYLYFWKMKMHSYSQKCQSDQQRLEVLMYLSLTYRFVFSLYLLFTWMCTHFVQNIAALFSLSLKLHYLPLFLWKSGILYCGHLNKELNQGSVIVWGDNCLSNCIKLVFPATCQLVWWSPLLQSSNGFHCA